MLRAPLPTTLNYYLAIHSNDSFWTVQKDQASLSAVLPTTPRRPVQTGRLPTAAYQPLRVAARPQPRSLGAARTRRRGQISDLDRREPAPPSGLRRSARGQARLGGAPSGAACGARAAEATCRSGRHRSKKLP